MNTRRNKRRSPNAFGSRLRAEREKRGWTQARVAEEVERLYDSQAHLLSRYLGVCEEMVRRWESGKHLPRPLYRHLLCELFAISEEECKALINGSTSEPY